MKTSNNYSQQKEALINEKRIGKFYICLPLSLFHKIQTTALLRNSNTFPFTENSKRNSPKSLFKSSNFEQ